MNVLGDISSISGSGSDDESSDEDTKQPVRDIIDNDSDDDDDDDDDDYEMAHVEGPGRRHPKVFFYNQQNNIVSMYRCIIHGKKVNCS